MGVSEEVKMNDILYGWAFLVGSIGFVLLFLIVFGGSEMKISESGTCVMSSDCIPTKFNPTFRKGKEGRREYQHAYVEKHDCFMSGGRVYATLADRIVDAVTGTLYTLSGQCLSHDADLMVDVKNKVTDKESILKFIFVKY